MAYQRIRVAPVTGALGAEIEGVDLAAPLNDATFAEVREAWLEHLVLFFRDQRLTPEQHKAFGRRFGTLNLHPFVEGLDGHPEIIAIIKEPDERNNWGEGWHSDTSFLEQPSMGSILYGREVPPYGGDTLFANMYLAYETLSEGMKDLLDGLVAVHGSGEAGEFSESYRSMRGRNAAGLTAEHPVVRRHPETGRRLLYVNRVFTRRFKDMTEAESRPLLEVLFSHVERPEFACRFRWSENAVAFWDNRATQHFAVADDFRSRVGEGFRRCMHRVTIDGDRPH